MLIHVPLNFNRNSKVNKVSNKTNKMLMMIMMMITTTTVTITDNNNINSNNNKRSKGLNKIARLCFLFL